MNLTPREKDKLLVAMAAVVARRRLERGVKLNYPEAIALITDFVVEGARDGRSVAELMRDGAEVTTVPVEIDEQGVVHDLAPEEEPGEDQTGSAGTPEADAGTGAGSVRQAGAAAPAAARAATSQE